MWGWGYGNQLGMIAAPPPAPKAKATTPLQKFLEEGGHDPSGAPDGGKPSKWAPGRQGLLTAMSVLGTGTPIGTLTGALNAGMGLHAGRQQFEMLGWEPTRADLIDMAGGTSWGERDKGRGGYGNAGIGDFEGFMNMADPGVAGPARGMARDSVSIAGGDDPADDYGWDDDYDDNYRA